MKLNAHLNANKDLIVEFTFPGEEIEDLAVGTPKELVAPGTADAIGAQYASHAGRALTEDEGKELASAIKGAKVTDGIAPKD